jgi:two-component system, chemotaxis family, chemotaxis protein CheY
VLVRALVVDDSSAMRAILKMIMKKAGFEVFEAGNGREALDVLSKSGAVDLVLVDWNMPEMNGFELVIAMRANHEYDKTRLVMVTTEADIDEVSKALAAGADEYIMKPFTREVVVEKLQMLGF